MTMRFRRLQLAAALCAPLYLTACGGDDDAKSESDAGDEHEDGGDGHEHEDAGDEHEDGGDEGDAQSDAGTPKPDPTYALATQVFGPSSQTSYLLLHKGDLFKGKIEVSGGVERAGRALTVAGVAPGSVFYAGDQLPEVDRYKASDDKLTKQDNVSFMGQGLMAVGEYAGQLVMRSETKALYFDTRTLKVVVWNPKDMTLIKAIDVGDLKLANFSATFSTLTIRRGDKVYMPVGYRTPAAVPSTTAMVIVDTANDSASVVKDDRCGYVRDAVEGEDGKIYLATEAFASAVYHLNKTAAPAPCLLRFDPETDKYDSAFKADLNTLADGKTVGSLIKLPNGKAYVRVLDESKVPKLDMPSGRALASARAWGWSEITQEDTPALTPVDGYVMGGSFVPMPLGDKLVLPDFAADQTKTTLCDVSEGPSCDTKTEIDGLVFSVALLN